MGVSFSKRNDPTGAAARKFLADLGLPYDGANMDNARRYANKAERIMAQGLPVDRGVLRGHTITPEHPGRKRRVLPAPASAYRAGSGRRSKYETTTQKLYRGPAIQRPRSHRRPPGQKQGAIPIPGHAIVTTVFTQREALDLVLGAASNGDRVQFQVFDCDSQSWRTVYGNKSRRQYRGPWQGRTALDLLAVLRDSGESLEERLIADAVSIEGDSDQFAPPISHICIYMVIVLPVPIDATGSRILRRRA
jgi:hypothetical protein